MTKEQLIVSIKDKPNLGVYDTQHRNDGTVDIDGLPIFEIVYEKPPENFRLVRVVEHLKCAVLEDLDYVEPLNETVTPDTTA
jgi:hypothetical protein